jgi:RNA polymerase sigma-70 factor (ECF subfamily)
MPPAEPDIVGAEGGARQFATTHWSVVLRAGDSHAPQSAEALEALCRDNWYPLYGFVRSRGYGPEEACDLTQAFFARLLEKKWLKDADRERGRFRTFLLAALKHFLSNEWNRGQTIKRGGGCEWIALDAVQAEERLAMEPADVSSPDSLYDRRWATNLIARVQDRLQDEMIAAGQGDRFEALEPTLAGEPAEAGYKALATRFGLTETGVKSIVLRLRRRFRELLREEIAETLCEGQDVEEELRELFKAM